MKIGPRITFFLNISNISKNYLKDFFILSQILVQVWYNLNAKRAKRLKFSFLVI